MRKLLGIIMIGFHIFCLIYVRRRSHIYHIDILMLWKTSQTLHKHNTDLNECKLWSYKITILSLCSLLYHYCINMLSLWHHIVITTLSLRYHYRLRLTLSLCYHSLSLCYHYVSTYEADNIILSHVVLLL